MRPYYRGTVSFTYVSEESMKDVSLNRIIETCDTGPALAGPVSLDEITVDRAEADRLAVAYGSDVEFFGDRVDDNEKKDT